MTTSPAPARPPDGPPPSRPAFTGYRLPLDLRPNRLETVASLVVHGALIAAFLWRGAALVGGGPGTSGPRGGGGGGRPARSFFALPPPSAPVAVDIPSPPVVALAELPTPHAITLDLARIEVSGTQVAAVSGAGRGPGSGGGAGTGSGPGAGVDAGPGTGGDGGYIFPASPRRAIVPPMSNRPASLRGKQIRVKFWITAQGRVSRVELDPEINDDAYRREFVARMLEYVFEPAKTRTGEPIASVYSMTATL